MIWRQGAGERYVRSSILVRYRMAEDGAMRQGEGVNRRGTEVGWERKGSQSNSPRTPTASGCWCRFVPYGCSDCLDRLPTTFLHSVSMCVCVCVCVRERERERERAEDSVNLRSFIFAHQRPPFICRSHLYSDLHVHPRPEPHYSKKKK